MKPTSRMIRVKNLVTFHWMCFVSQPVIHSLRPTKIGSELKAVHLLTDGSNMIPSMREIMNLAYHFINSRHVIIR